MSYILVNNSFIRVSTTDLSKMSVLTKLLISVVSSLRFYVLGMEGLILGAMLILIKLSNNQFDLSHVSHNLLLVFELAAVVSTGLS